jgi:hypothetical protein
LPKLRREYLLQEAFDVGDSENMVRLGYSSEAQGTAEKGKAFRKNLSNGADKLNFPELNLLILIMEH